MALILTQDCKLEAALLLEKSMLPEAVASVFPRICSDARLIALPTAEERMTGQNLKALAAFEQLINLDLLSEQASELISFSPDIEENLYELIPKSGFDDFRLSVHELVGNHPDGLAMATFLGKFARTEIEKRMGEEQVSKLKKDASTKVEQPIITWVFNFLREHITRVQTDPTLTACITPYCIAIGHLRALTEPKYQTKYHQEIALSVIREKEGREDESPEVERFAGELLVQLRRAARLINIEGATQEEILNPISQDGMLSWDARAAQFIARLGDTGRENAAKLRSLSRERWATFCSAKGEERNQALAAVWSLCWADMSARVTPLPFAYGLARVLWLDVVKPRLERERYKPSALVFRVHEEAISAHTPGGQLQRHQGDILVNHRNEKVSDLRRIEPLKKVPALELRVLPQILRKGSKLLGTLNAYRLLHLEVSLGHQHALDDKNKDVRALRFEGGWEALAEAAGIEGNSRAITEVHAIIAAQAHLCFVSPDGSYGNLLSYEVRPATGHHRGRISLILGDALLPDFIFSPGFFGNGRSAREARRLVPMLPLPPLVGRPNDKGAQVNLQLRLLAEMRRRATEFYEEGGVLLSSYELENFAKEATLPLTTLRKVIDRWTQDGEDGPALLELIEEDRYTLGKTHVDARNFIAEAGREEIQGKEAGLKSRELDRKR